MTPCAPEQSRLQRSDNPPAAVATVAAPAEGLLPLLNKQMPLAISPARHPTLANFVVGANAGLLAHLQAWPAASAAGTAAASGSAPPPAPLYLWGPEASGKTHVLRGVAARLAGAGAAVGWFNAQDPEPWELQPHWALVVVDNADRLDAARQHAAFVLFTEAVTHGVAFAAAGALPPADLPLRDDLRTRLAWGHVFALQALSEAETREALASEARRRDLAMPAEVENYLLSRFPRDLGTLMQLLADLDNHGIATQRRLTVPLVRDLITHAA